MLNIISKAKVAVLFASLCTTLCLSTSINANEVVAAGSNIATLRSGASLDITPEAPRLGNNENKDIRRARNYPMQPPTIPHKIENYQIDLKTNKCMSCHSRSRVEDSNAPMVSVTHFMNRDGNFLAEISPRRYFCNQCHVPQNEAKLLLKNEFVDIDSLLSDDGAQ